FTHIAILIQMPIIALWTTALAQTQNRMEFNHLTELPEGQLMYGESFPFYLVKSEQIFNLRN
ncbi:MAG: hypothetical protein ABIQ95_07090, partial [Bdellovibrionia bacterium]